MLEMTIVRTFLSLFWQLGLPIHSECASNSTRQNRTIFTKKSHGEFQGQFCMTIALKQQQQYEYITHFFYPTSRSISKRGKDSSWSVQCNVMLMVELPILHGTLQDNALSARCIAVPFSNTHNRIRIYMQKVKSVVSKKKAKIQMASKIILLYF